MAAQIYPNLAIGLNKKPNRHWAFPILGGFVKLLFVLPVSIEIGVLSFVGFFIMIVASFIVLGSGEYPEFVYNYFLGLLRLSAKVAFFLQGLTDKYPGFGLDSGDFTLNVDYPKNPSRFFAFPLLGGIARVLLLLPFVIWQMIVEYGANLGVVVSSVPVLFKGYYPESTHELARDSMRLGLASGVYLLGLSDKYPSFVISKNHLGIKVVLIILGMILGGCNAFSGGPRREWRYRLPPQIQNYQQPGSFNNTIPRGNYPGGRLQ